VRRLRKVIAMRILAGRSIITAIVVISSSTSLSAGTITTSFVGNPFGVWCERFHDVSWNSGAQRIDVQGSTSCAGNPCCTGCSGTHCSSANGDAGFILTKASEETTTSGRNRTASVKWAFSTSLVGGRAPSAVCSSASELSRGCAIMGLYRRVAVSPVHGRDG
jgi:hypothetical protein